MTHLNGNTSGNENQTTPDNFHRVREVRIEKGLTLEELAVRLGKSVPTVAWEEQPTFDLPVSGLRAWSEALEVSVDYLLIDQVNPIGLPRLTGSRIKQMENSAQKIAESAGDKATATFANGLLRQIRELFNDTDGPPGEAWMGT